MLQRLRTDPDGDVLAARDDLERLFTRVEPFVRGVCRDHLRGVPAQIVEEAVQDVLVVAWRKLPGLQADGRIEGWLFGIARRVCSNLRRKRGEVLSDRVPDPSDPALTALAGLRRDERERVVLQAAVRVLDDLEQQVLWLRLVDERTRDEIAAETGLPNANAVRVTLQRCLRKVTPALAEELQALGHGTSLLRDSDL